PEQYKLFSAEETEESGTEESEYESEIIFSGEEKDRLKRDIYEKLSEITGIIPEWGIHTGVRPVKLMRELTKKLGSAEAAKRELKDGYLFSDEKLELTENIYHTQQRVLGSPEKNSVGIYIGIPFCPTRCLYCSFTSNQSPPEKIRMYLDALLQEIEYTGRKMKEMGWYPESIYIGGGTPTTLTAEQLDRLLKAVRNAYDLTKTKEFTVEAGRPDTITPEKLKAIRDNGVQRISINPQSMKEETLKIIGRSHSSQDIVKAFEMAKEAGIPIINADVIAGLPGESAEDFERTLDIITELGAENITVHTLAVKRASRLIDVDSGFHYKQAETVRKMLALSKRKMAEKGYYPYYLYRQKHMAGSLENIGYTKEGYDGIYNIRIMDENQSIVALGAGGISKIYFPEENRLERVPNVSNFEIYIERLDEMLKRKEENLFKEVK
ncbi:MAG: coproporphyrinogen dehydrogenase HemZ, partial [Anaerovoracaceae bacterium]